MTIEETQNPDVVDTSIPFIFGKATDIAWMHDRLLINVEFSPIRRTIVTLGSEEIVHLFSEILREGNLFVIDDIKNLAHRLWYFFEDRPEGLTLTSVQRSEHNLYDALKTARFPDEENIVETVEVAK